MQKFNDNVAKMLSLLRVEAVPAPNPKPMGLFDLVYPVSCSGGAGVQSYRVDLNSTLMKTLNFSQIPESSLGTTHLTQVSFVRVAIAAMAKHLGLSEEQFLGEFCLENQFFESRLISFDGTVFVVRDKQIPVTHLICNVDSINLCFFVYCDDDNGCACDLGDGFVTPRSSERAVLSAHVLLPKALRGTLPAGLLFSGNKAQEESSPKSIAPQDILAESTLATLLDEVLSRLGSVSFGGAGHLSAFSFRRSTIRSERVSLPQNFSYTLLCDPSLSIIDQVDIVLTDEHNALVLMLEGITMANLMPLVLVDDKAEHLLGKSWFLLYAEFLFYCFYL